MVFHSQVGSLIGINSAQSNKIIFAAITSHMPSEPHLPENVSFGYTYSVPMPEFRSVKWQEHQTRHSEDPGLNPYCISISFSPTVT